MKAAVELIVAASKTTRMARRTKAKVLCEKCADTRLLILSATKKCPRQVNKRSDK